MTPPEPLTADLLLEHSGFLHGLARSLVQDEQHAEDVVQETYVAVLGKPPPPHVRLRAWLAAITRNLALRSRRTEGRVRRREQHGARPETTAATVDVAARVEVQRRIAEAVAALDEPGRTAIVWRYFDGLPPREIARLEGVSVRTIESRLRRAREALRAHLDAQHGGRRGAWCAVLLPIVGADLPHAVTSSAAGAAAAPATSATAGAAGGLTAAAAVGVTLVSTKLILGVAAVCVAGAFFIGREFPATPAEPVQTDAPDPSPAAADAPTLENDAELVISRLRESVASAEDANAALRAVNEKLEADLEAARAAGYVPPGEAPAGSPEDGLPYAPAKYKKAVAGVTWTEAGEAAAKMVPLLRDLTEVFVGKKEADQRVGLKIFEHNQKLQTVAVAAIAADVPGAASNGAFTHPAVAINLIHAALEQAKLPLDEGQLTRMRAIGDSFIEADERRAAGYNEETFALQKIIDECALKDRMFADIDGLLRPEQRDVLHPEAIRDRLGIDIYSSGTIWYAVSKPVDFKTREDLAAGLVHLYRERGNLADEDVALLTAAAKDWADGFSEEFLQASLDPLAQASRREAAGGMLAGWQRCAQARTAAIHQLALNRALHDLVRNDAKSAAKVRGDSRVFIPIKLP